MRGALVMLKQNIANFILYNLEHTDLQQSMKVDTGLISDVVEGWNKQIYITPKQPIILNKSTNKKITLM